MKIGILLAAVAIGASTLTAAAPQYRLVDLGIPPGAVGSGAYAINDNGQVVGYGYDWDRGGALVWQNGSMQSLPHLAGFGSTSALGINSAGIVVGASGFRAVQWSNGTVRDLTLLPGGQFLIGAYDINDSGLAVGTSLGAAVESAVLVTANGVVELPRHPGDSFSRGFAINNAGVSVGQSGSNAMMWIEQSPLVLGTGSALAVNEFNDAAGVVRTGVDNRGFDVFRAVIWQFGETEALLPLPSGYAGSVARGINDANAVVGYGGAEGFRPTLQNVANRALLWENGFAYPLDHLVQDADGWVLTEAWDINNHMQIVGAGIYQHQSRAFMLSPVPEPSALVMLLAGFALIGCASELRNRVRWPSSVEGEAPDTL